jgi:hypothetical protein
MKADQVEVWWRFCSKHAEMNSQVSLHGWPPKSLTQEGDSPVHARVTGEDELNLAQTEPYKDRF